VLAYAGASLPLLLFFTQGDQPVERLLTSELIAVEIVRMLVGSIGLVASVPITTALAALVMGAGRAEADDDDFPWPTDGDALDRPTPVPAGPHPPAGDREADDGIASR
jgi:hypothetical protein